MQQFPVPGQQAGLHGLQRGGLSKTSLTRLNDVFAKGVSALRIPCGLCQIDQFSMPEPAIRAGRVRVAVLAAPVGSLAADRDALKRAPMLD